MERCVQDCLTSLIRDFKSCSTPLPDDPMTIKVLDIIAIHIYNGLCTEQEFYTFLEENMGNGYFALSCKEYVSKLLNNKKY